MRPPRAFALALLLAAVLPLSSCFADEGEDANLPPFTPVSRAVETDVGLLVGAWPTTVGAERGATRLDSQTLEELAGVAPLRDATMDPTGRWVAALDPRPSTNGITDVLVYDLETWELAWRADDLPAGELQWDESGLYLWADACPDPLPEGACAEPWIRGVWRLDEAGVEELARFDFTPFVRTRNIGPDGTRAYVIGAETQVCCGIAIAGDPFVAAINLETGAVDPRVTLPGLRLGQPGDWLGRTDLPFGGSYWPAAVLSSDGGRMYVVHAERDEVTSVDLHKGQVVATYLFADPDSVASRLGAWLVERFARTAEAKMSAEYIRRVGISPDGRYLFVSGSEPTEGPEELEVGEPLPLGPSGLEVIDLETMDVVYRDARTWGFTLAPDGYSLLTWGYPSYAAGLPTGLRVVDLRTMEPRQLFDRLLVTAVLASPAGGVAFAEIAGLQPGKVRVLAFDIATGEVTAERALDEYEWLIDLSLGR